MAYIYINNCIEDETHVILNCPVYEDLRQYLFNHTCMHNNNVKHLSDADQYIFYLLMRICVFILMPSYFPVSILIGATAHLILANAHFYSQVIFFSS
jgi:hypothetical protein